MRRISFRAEVSRYLLVDNRQCGQSAYVMWTLPKQHKDPAILKVRHWRDERSHEPAQVEELATRFGSGERNFIRRFKEATGACRHRSRCDNLLCSHNRELAV